MGLPIELSDAARVDGASELGIFWRIILPWPKPALAVVACSSHWELNDYFGPVDLPQRQEALHRLARHRQHASTYGFMNYAWIIGSDRDECFFRLLSCSSLRSAPSSKASALTGLKDRGLA